MAAEVVGGAFLSVSLQVLSGRIRSIMDFVRRNKVDAGLLNKLEIKLLSVNGVLNDAEKKQLTDQAVRQWLEKFKDAIHNAEDLVDEINTEALRCEIEEAGQSSTGGRRLSFFQVPKFFTSRINVRNVGSRIVEILDMLEYIVKEKDNLGLKEGVVVEGKDYPYRRPSETVLVKGSDVYGRDADKKAITDLLLSDDIEVGRGHKISVVPIVAMGGMGKTTLAQLVYNNIDHDAEMPSKKPFDLKVWITVSEEFDVFTLTKKIYEAVLPISRPKRTFQETFQLQRELEEILEGKKFLLVLDDVWNEDYGRWCDFKTPLESAEQGSKILVTTRSGRIASMMAGVPNQYYQLEKIPNEHGWQLFANHAFGNTEPSAYPADLERIGRLIVKKCQGLPLAIKSLAGLLCSDQIQDSGEWEKVLKNDIWDFPVRTGCNILPALWLSYYYLPSHLKRCFAYSSIFPKDYRIDKRELILLWMAQDLLQPQNAKKLEEVGEEYIKDLTSRSFFHGDEYGTLTMHDLVNDLAKFVSGECCLRLDDTNYSDGLMRKTRHFSAMICKRQDIKKLEDLSKNKVLRTLLVSYYSREKEYLTKPQELQSMQYLRAFRVPNDLLFTYKEPLDSIGSLKLLRYLDLSYCGIKEIPAHSIGTLYNLQTLLLRSCRELIGLPDSIGNLKKLRYLELSCSAQIEKIPETVCNLPELRTLLLLECSMLSCLPTNITTLTSLSHLGVSRTGLKEMPPNMSNLKNLRNLDMFIVGKDSGRNFKELGQLQHLRGDLRIKSLENIVDVKDISKANLKDKKHITELSLEWGWNSDIVDSRKAREVLDGLRPHTNLKSIRIENYGGTSLSHWVGHVSFSRIKTVRLSNCKYCWVLPPLGQLPSLELLEIKGFDMVERVGDEFYYSRGSDGTCSPSVTSLPFESLTTLSFVNMPEWKEWSSCLMNMEGGPVFSNLKGLEFYSCGKLDGACLPDYLPSLETLWIWGNSQLAASLSRCRYPSLDYLCMSDCAEIESFPQGRLPSSICKIVIGGCRRLVSLSEEGWPSNLKSLELWGCDGLFEHSATEWHLPKLTSLTSLHLHNLNNIKSLNGMAFRYLTSLQKLEIFWCEQLQGLPEQGLPTSLLSLDLRELASLESLSGNAFRHLTSLQKLSIYDCEKLQCLPEEGLPATLSYLSIDGCRLLSPRWQRETGEDWPKIQHISRILIDGEDI